MAGDESGPSLYRTLADQCSSLEASYVKLKEVLSEMAEEKNRSDMDTPSRRRMIMMSDSDYVTSDFGPGLISGFFKEGTPYRKVLNSIGHAIVVCSAASGEITFWNHSAERLYGWKDYEVLGESVAELLVAEEYYEPFNTIIENLLFGQSWSGQFPFRRRSGDIFMALVTKSPMYTDGKLTGIITCSSDAEIFNTGHSEKQRVYQNRDRAYKNTIQWNSRPQIASSVSNLASKFKLRKHGDDATDAHDISGDQEHTATKPGALAAKMLAKFHIRGFGKRGKDHNAADQQNGPCGNPVRNKATNDNYRSSEPSISNGYSVQVEHRREINFRRNSSDASQHINLNVNASRSLSVSDESCQASPWGYKGSLQFANQTESFSRFVCIEEMDELEPEGPNLEDPENENEAQRQQDGKRFSSSGESSGSSGSSTNRGDKESSALADCEIRWEDLQLGEDIGQGSFAVVYRGTWNGSDVAVKHYFASEFKEETLKDHKKEIGIMKRLRHPNVLLFMGAVFSPDRPAIVTEFMPRGSLFKTLHKNNQALDMKRRLRMALDVARGMNYLHHRNPPIVHRDLKSSNLLVDRNWTVKVGDFGLSRWKNATFLSARSANGTPQWMAPEVLRNEPSNEKSDVFSFGVILWELMTVSVPWANLNSLQVVGVVGFMDRRLEVPESVDPRIASMIRECWRSDPAQRPSFEDIIDRMSAIIQTSRS